MLSFVVWFCSDFMIQWLELNFPFGAVEGIRSINASFLCYFIYVTSLFFVQNILRGFAFLKPPFFLVMNKSKSIVTCVLVSDVCFSRSGFGLFMLVLSHDLM